MSEVRLICEKAREAFLSFSSLGLDVRNVALEAMAEALDRGAKELLAANQEDCRDAEEAVSSGNMSHAVFKRLSLDINKLQSMVDNLHAVRELDNPLGSCDYACRLDDGLVLRRVTCPLGVVAAIFEARPDAISQIASLCIKSGNAVILKGGKEALRTNRTTARLLKEAVALAGVPSDALQLLEAREEVRDLLDMDDLVDLIVPRGGNAFVRYIRENTRTPVLGHADGICHLYVDRAVDRFESFQTAIAIVLDAKTNYPAACNSVETILVHEEVAMDFLPLMISALGKADVEVRGCSKTCQIVSDLVPATDDDWDTEFLDLIVSVRIVTDLTDAVGHINQHGSKHTDGIITEDKITAERFLNGVDASSVLWNASTRFADGYRYGLGAEVGISTEKLHARGPVGLEGLVTYKYQVVGSGHCVNDYMGENARAFQHAPLSKDTDIFSQ